MPTKARTLQHLTSTNPTLIELSADLNAVAFIEAICGKAPIARYVDKNDIVNPPAPAWYLPSTNDIYIHVDAAELGKIPNRVHCDRSQIHGNKFNAKVAKTLGLLAHEAAHAAISDNMDLVMRAAPKHGEVLTLLEELRVENYALRKVPQARKFLRASFGLILSALPDEFTSKAHVVRAWAIARGRTLAGVALPDETNAVDVAARTLLGDDIVDGLTDLLQEALTLRLHDTYQRERMVAICDEWTALVGETAEATGCTTCVRSKADADKDEGEGESEKSGTSSAKPEGDEGDDESEDGSGGDDEGDESDDEAPGGSGEGDADDADEGDDEGESGQPGDADSDSDGDSDYGSPGAHDPSEDSDDGHADDSTLTDEDAELMKMVKRDLADEMSEEWSREPEVVDLANAGEWGQKVFGNRKQSNRLVPSQPTPGMRQHVVKVSDALSNLMLPAVSKVSKSTVTPPGRLRSREALRASVERAQGKMVTAQPWKTQVRRHSTSRPLVLGVATDTSGSMRWAEDGVAEFAYVYANAGHRIGARTAAVTFGDHVHRIARPGEVMTDVLTKTASDGTEEMDYAMASLDGVLKLTTPSYAARILFVVSDGHFVKGGEVDRAYEWMKRMDKAGTHIVWIADRIDSDMMWLRQAEKLPHFTRRAVFTPKPGDSRFKRPPATGVFNILNQIALDVIQEHIR